MVEELLSPVETEKIGNRIHANQRNEALRA